MLQIPCFSFSLKTVVNYRKWDTVVLPQFIPLPVCIVSILSIIYKRKAYFNNFMRMNLCSGQNFQFYYLFSIYCTVENERQYWRNKYPAVFKMSNDEKAFHCTENIIEKDKEFIYILVRNFPDQGLFVKPRNIYVSCLTNFDIWMGIWKLKSCTLTASWTYFSAIYG